MPTVDDLGLTLSAPSNFDSAGQSDRLQFTQVQVDMRHYI